MATTPTIPDDDVAPDADIVIAGPGQQMVMIWAKHADLLPSPDNLRGTLTDISDLADSIAELGILEPLTVTPNDRGGWTIIAGHRRHAAVATLIAAGRWPASRRLPCTVGQLAVDDADAIVVAQLVENLQRVDLDPIDEANGYRRLVNHQWTPAKIAAATGRNKARVAGRLKLLNMPGIWQRQLRHGEITLEYATRLAAAPAEAVTKLATKPAPAQHVLDQALRDHEATVFRTQTAQACKARGIRLENASRRWEIARDHDQVATSTPAALAKALLPDRADMVAVLLHYPGAGKAEVLVYAPRDTVVDAATAAAGEGAVPSKPAELSPAQQRDAECRRLDQEHRAALAAFQQARKEFLATWATTVDADQVAEAAIVDTMNAYEGEIEECAVRVGYNKPALDLDADLAQAALTEWLTVRRNRTATLALLFGGLNDAHNPMTGLAAEALTAAGLTEPARPVWPPHPDDVLDPETSEPIPTDDAPDEDEAEWDDGEPNPYATDDDDTDLPDSEDGE